MKRVVSGILAVVVAGTILGVLDARSHPGATPRLAPPSVLSSIASASPIALENAKKGSSDWRLHSARSNHRIAGYASRTSVSAGASFDVYVDTRAATYRADIFRMGYYGGAGGRRVASIDGLVGHRQSSCETTTVRHTVQCDWQRSFRVDTHTDWESGVYLVKLSASDGTQSWVPFVVRERSPAAPIVVQTSVTTWQAYNAWGGRNLYSGPCVYRGTVIPPSSDEDQQPAPSGTSSPAPASASPSPHAATRGAASPQPGVSVFPSASPTPFPSVTPTASPDPSPSPSVTSTAKPRAVYDCGAASRSRAASFDRPYMFPGDGQFFRFEYPLVYWLESQGMYVAYATDVDLHEGFEALDSRRVSISAGHDEYYSSEMRDSLEKALAGGTSLAFFGGNDLYRHIRFEPSPLGPDRIEVNYKSAAEDPYLRIDRTQVTSQWREWPVNRPEQALLGAQYECNPARADWVATGEPAWLYRGTGFAAGDSVPNLVGYEYDRIMGGYPSPPNVVAVASSPLRCGRLKTQSNSTFYVAPSGAGVFDAGTLWFPCALGPDGCVNASDSHPAPDPRLQRLVRNLIFAMLARRFL